MTIGKCKWVHYDIFVWFTFICRRVVCSHVSIHLFLCKLWDITLKRKKKNRWMEMCINSINVH